jgi:type VI secretion system protein ImpJ
MSINNKVTPAIQWHEGMLLEPHHFQQNDLRYGQLLAQIYKSVSPFGWGVEDISMDPVVLVGGLIRINQLKAIMPDGYYVEFDAKIHGSLEFDIKKNVPTLEDEPVPVYVIMHAYRPGDGNAIGPLARYDSVTGDPVVDENTGDNALSLPRVIPRLDVYVGDPPAHFICLQIAEVSLKDNAYTLSDYIPPLLKVRMESPLSQKCAEMISRMRRKVAFLIGQIQGVNSQKLVVSDIKDALKVFVQCLPPLEALIYSGQSHPHAIFTCLAHMSGALSTLKLGVIPPVFDFYQHNNLNVSFKKAIQFVSSIVDTIQDGYTVVPFTRTDRLFSLKLSHELVSPIMVLGLKTPSGATDADMESWVSEAVIVTESYVKMAQDRRILGLKRRIIYAEESMRLVPMKGITLIAITYDPSFMRLDESLILFNLSDSEAKRPLDVILYMAKQNELESVA